MNTSYCSIPTGVRLDFNIVYSGWCTVFLWAGKKNRKKDPGRLRHELPGGVGSSHEAAVLAVFGEKQRGHGAARLQLSDHALKSGQPVLLLGGDAAAHDDGQARCAGGDAPEADGHVLEHDAPLAVVQVLGFDAAPQAEPPVGDVAPADERLQMAEAAAATLEPAVLVDDDVAELGGVRYHTAIDDDDESRADPSAPDDVDQGLPEGGVLSHGGGFRIVHDDHGNVERGLEVCFEVGVSPARQIAGASHDTIHDYPGCADAAGHQSVSLGEETAGLDDLRQRHVVVVRVRLQDTTADFFAVLVLQ